MKTSLLGKWGVLVAAISITIPIVISSSLAQQLPSSLANKSNNVLACAAQADLKFGDFLSSSIGYDGFVDYWVDIFGKNRCEQLDIENVFKNLKQVRAGIRSAFYSCDDDRANKLGIAYNKLLAELYYVRHITTTDQQNPHSALTIVNPALYSEMQTKFVNDKSYFSQKDFDDLFKSLTQKYQKSLDPDRKGSYFNCDDPVFDELIDKWQQFLDTAGGLKTGTEAAVKSVNREVTRLEKMPPQNYGNTYWRFVDVKINGLDPLDGLDQIYENTKRDLPFTDVGVTHEQLFNSSTQARNDFNASQSKAQMMAKYEFLYLNTTDSLRDSLEKKLKETNRIIKDTFQPLSGIGDCVGTVYSRQCKSSE